MNELNYASFEASKKLYEAGIVLGTDAVWYEDYTTSRPRWIILHRGVLNTTEKTLPAPSMTELLREMPIETSVEKTDDGGYIVPAWKWNRYYCNENPADALIELLIWLRKEKA